MSTNASTFLHLTHALSGCRQIVDSAGCKKRRLGAFFYSPKTATIALHMVGVVVDMISTKMKQALRIVSFTSIFLSANAQAIALGEIHLSSTLLQPLQLHVDLIEVEGVLPGSMAAKVAGPAQFLSADLVYHPWYSQLDVSIVDNEGDYVVQVIGQQAVEETLLDFIFEVDYLGGRLLAEYAVKLPAFEKSQQLGENTNLKPNLKPNLQPTVDSKVLVKALAAEVVLEEALTQQSESKSVVTNVEPKDVAAAFVVVKPGQTLWRIAVNNTPKGISPWQTLISLYKVNPAAYRNNDIRQVLVNSRLRLPTVDELSSLTAKQAKAAYEVLVPTPVKVKQKKPTQSQLAAAKIQQYNAQQAQLQQQVQGQQDKLNGLTSQSIALQAEVESLQADHTVAISEQELLTKASENLAYGVAVQKQDIKNLNEERAQLENNMLTLDQKFESTQADLNQAEQDLLLTQKSLVDMQQSVDLAEQTKVFSDNGEHMSQGLSLVQVLAFLLVPIIMVVGLIWWIIGRGRKIAPEHQAPLEISDEQPITLDPLADYNTKPSAKIADLHQSAKKMQGGMPERSFIEELLQQQGQDETQSMGQNFHEKIADDQVHLSADIEAMLTGQKQMHNQADEPVEYLSHEEEMNTKLYLALSYRDMGEVSQAQTVLHEVLNQGNDEQKAQASDLLSSINKV
jgi:FimV-like protein